MKKLPSLSVVFPAFNDEQTIGKLVKKTLRLLPKVASRFEIVIVNDASTDNTGGVLQKLEGEIPSLHVITHTKNRGYGGALIAGFRKAKKEWIFYTDSDGQYDVRQLCDLAAAWDKNIDMVAGFKLQRADPWFRKIIGFLYNWMVKYAFDLTIRDVDCDFRLFRKSILKDMDLTVYSGVFDAAFMWQCTLKRIKIKEVPIRHYPRPFGSSQFFTVPSLWQSFTDLFSLFIRRFAV